MKNIKVTLLHHTPLYIASDGARTCWSSQDKSDTCHHVNIHEATTEMCSSECLDCESLDIDTITVGPKDLALIDRVGNQFHHSSILEHISFNFFIDGISRACLQEISRHRHASPSVKSSRFTLKELKGLTPFIEDYGHLMVDDNHSYINTNGVLASDYLVMTDSDAVNINSIFALERLRQVLASGISNDKAKYCMPEAYRTQLTWTINLRSLQNFLFLRSDRKALPEIQLLSNLLYQALPVDAQSLIKHCLKTADEL